MKNNKFKKVVVCLAFAAFVGSVSSCNRGYGCPNNFSVETVAAKVIHTVAQAFIQE